MAKNKLGKFLAFTTTVVAIGGACYIFRDKIKATPVYKKASDKLSGLFGNDECEAEDFFFDDDDFNDDDEIFSANKKGREYTSITVTATQKDDATEETVTTSEETIDAFNDIEKVDPTDDETKEVDTSETEKEDIAEPTPTLSFNSIVVTDNEPKETVTAYENEGLSDVYEDPDVLEEQDKLDF